MNISTRDLAMQIANTLNATDNSSNNRSTKKINASVWNNFVADKGGKEIKNYIDFDNAIRSIMVYLDREARANNTSVSTMAEEWLDKLNQNENQLTPINNDRVDNEINNNIQEIVENSSDNIEAENNEVQEANEKSSEKTDLSYSKMTKSEALQRAQNDPRLEKLNGGQGWSVADKSFITDIPFAKKHTGDILSFVSQLIGEHITVTSALGTGGASGQKSPHRDDLGYCSHHNAENPKLDIRKNGHGKELQKKLLETGLFSRVDIEWDHLDIQISPAVYDAMERGYNLNHILACAQNNTLERLMA